MSFYTQIDNQNPTWFNSNAGLELMPHELYLREKDRGEIVDIFDSDKTYSGLDSCALNDCAGFILNVSEGCHVQEVIETTFSLKTNQTTQKIKNLIVIEEGASVSIKVKCESLESCTEGFHLGFDEIYLKKDAKLNIEITHTWSQNIQVRPAGKIVLGENAILQASYSCLQPVNDLKFLPLVELNGKNAKASFLSTVQVYLGSDLKIGQRIMLNGDNTMAESQSKIVSKGGKIENFMLIEASGENVKGHIDCQGLILEKNAEIKAVPELIVKSPTAELSHEAAIGGLNKAELEYLQARGLSLTQAVSLLTRGFLGGEKDGLLFSN